MEILVSPNGRIKQILTIDEQSYVSNIVSALDAYAKRNFEYTGAIEHLERALARARRCMWSMAAAVAVEAIIIWVLVVTR